MARRKNKNKVKIKDIKKKSILRNFRYPKFFIFLLTIFLGVLIFKERSFPFLEFFTSNTGYLGTFITGIFFSWAFTAAPATAIFLIIGKSQNIFLAILIGSLGSLIGDLLIFHFIRFSFKDEIRCLEKEKAIRWLDKELPEKTRHYLLIFFADILLASPLPDEIGIAILATYNKVSVKLFSLMSYILHAMGIAIILLIGQSI